MHSFLLLGWLGHISLPRMLSPGREETNGPEPGVGFGGGGGGGGGLPGANVLHMHQNTLQCR